MKLSLITLMLQSNAYLNIGMKNFEIAIGILNVVYVLTLYYENILFYFIFLCWHSFLKEIIYIIYNFLQKLSIIFLIFFSYIEQLFDK